MLTPMVISQEASALSALIQVLSDPEKTKQQLEELQKAAKAATEAERKLVEERVSLQNEKIRVDEVVAKAEVTIREADEAAERASRMVSDSLLQKTQAENLAASALSDARSVVEQIEVVARDRIKFLQQDFEERLARSADLELEIVRKQERLDKVNAELEKLRGTIGV